MKCEYRRENGEPASSFDRTENFSVTVTFEVKQPIRRLDLAMALLSGQGSRIFSEVYSDKYQPVEAPAGIFTARFGIFAKYFKPEPYFLTLWAFDFENVEDNVEGVPFPIITDRQGDPAREGKRWGVVRLPLDWQPIEHLKHD
jgi:hypothetical protein